MRLWDARWPCCLVVLGACQSGPSRSSAEEKFADLEERLLSSEHVEVEFEITSKGAVESEVRGLMLIHGEYVSLFAQGRFMDQPAKVELVSTDRELRGGHDVAHILGPKPPGLREGLLLGLTRMGLLHNIAVLTTNRPPDGVDGSVRSWAQVGGFGEVGGGVSFDLTVAGQSAGSAVLQLEGGVPTVREQIVRFDEGEMRVVERYTLFAVR